MLPMALPSNLDAQLFHLVSNGKNAAEVIDLLDAGARIDLPFSLDYEIKRGQTTHIILTAIEALFVSWNLVDLSKVLTHVGPLPNIVFPNISSALHQVHYAKDDVYRNWWSANQKVLLGLTQIMNNSNFWNTPFFAPNMWECIAHKDLEKELHSHLPSIANALRNIPKLSDLTSLERVVHIPKSNTIQCGTLLCTKMGVDDNLHHTEAYQYLTNKMINHPLESIVSSCILQWEVDLQSATALKTPRKM